MTCPAAATVEADVGLPLERGVHRHPLRDRQQSRHIGHGVRRRADSDGAFGCRLWRRGRPPRADPAGRRSPWPPPPARHRRGPPARPGPHTARHPAVRGPRRPGRPTPAPRWWPATPRAHRSPGRPGCGASRAPGPWPTPDAVHHARGRSRRATATSVATPRPRRAAGTPAAASAERRAASRAAANRACPAAAEALSRSRAATRSTSADSAARCRCDVSGHR